MHQTRSNPQKPFDNAQGRHHRRSIRLPGYDYSQAGAYFVTIVAYQRECLFGEIVDGEMRLNRNGEIVQKWWDEISKHFPNAEIAVFVIMPNHVHGIIIINDHHRGTVPVPRNNPNLNHLENAQQATEIMERDNSMRQDGKTVNMDNATQDRGKESINSNDFPQTRAGRPRPYVNRHWDKLWRISNIGSVPVTSDDKK